MLSVKETRLRSGFIMVFKQSKSFYVIKGNKLLPTPAIGRGS